MTSLAFSIQPHASQLAVPLVVEDPHVVIAGFTGRDDQAVRHHLDELRAQGIAAPAMTPTFWVVPNWLLTLAPTTIEVSGPSTSGEVEPVLIRMPHGALYATVGSGHTDRALERQADLSESAEPRGVAKGEHG